MCRPMEVSCWLKAPAEHRAESKVCFFGYKSYPMSNWQYCCSSISQYNNFAGFGYFSEKLSHSADIRQSHSAD